MGVSRPMRAAGINRVSLGAQSFDAAALARRSAGSTGPAEIAPRGRRNSPPPGIDNFNLDLMYALPGQSREGRARRHRGGDSRLGPAHLSHYQLTLEPGTAFYYRPPALPDDELAFDDATGLPRSAWRRRDSSQYEVSAYARPGRQCRHNLNYWRFGDYLGIGAGCAWQGDG